MSGQMDGVEVERVRCSRDVVPAHAANIQQAAGVKGQRASLTGSLDGEDGGGGTTPLGAGEEGRMDRGKSGRGQGG